MTNSSDRHSPSRLAGRTSHLLVGLVALTLLCTADTATAGLMAGSFEPDTAWSDFVSTAPSMPLAEAESSPSMSATPRTEIAGAFNRLLIRRLLDEPYWSSDPSNSPVSQRVVKALESLLNTGGKGMAPAPNGPQSTEIPSAYTGGYVWGIHCPSAPGRLHVTPDQIVFPPFPGRVFRPPRSMCCVSFS